MTAPITLPSLAEPTLAELRRRYEETTDAETRTRYQMLLLPILLLPSTPCKLSCFQEEHKDLWTYEIGCLGKLTGRLFPRRTHCPC